MSGQTLRLSDEVEVDFQRLVSIAQGVLEGSMDKGWAAWREFANAHDVLDGWSEEWLVVPREHFRQLRLQALDRLAVTFVESGRLGQALECAQAALLTDPWRESAQNVAISIHIRQGNRTEALRQFRSYCRAMRGELGLPPARDLYDLVSGIGLPTDAPPVTGRTEGQPGRANALDGPPDAIRGMNRSQPSVTKDGRDGGT